MHTPNIVFIYCDQLSFRAIGAYGNSTVRTPNMDRLARQGVTFSKFYCNGPLCGPARHATYTGLTTFCHPHWAQPNCLGMPHLRYMGDYFVAAGYQTAAIGKLHGMPEDFDFGFETARQNWGALPTFSFNAYGQWVEERLRRRSDGEALRALIRQPHPGGYAPEMPDAEYYYMPPELSEEAWLLEETADFLDHRRDGRPFLLNLGIQHPHHPWETAPFDDERYDPEAITPPPNHACRSGLTEAYRRHEQSLRKGAGRELPQTERNRLHRIEMARYYACVTQVDKAIGRIMGLLERHGLADRTLVVLTSDHGEMLREFGRGGKVLMHEASVRVPFIVAGPGVPAGVRLGQLAEQIDILPTLLDYADIPKPDALPGISLRAAIERDAPTKPFVHSWLEFRGSVHAMMRTENYKLCRMAIPREGIDTIELYRTSDDPWEMHPLALNETGEEPDALRQRFVEYFWQHAGMVGCPPAVRQRLGGHAANHAP